jgi:hypothetical protein
MDEPQTIAIEAGIKALLGKALATIAAAGCHDVSIHLSRPVYMQLFMKNPVETPRAFGAPVYALPDARPSYVTGLTDDGAPLTFDEA